MRRRREGLPVREWTSSDHLLSAQLSTQLPEGRLSAFRTALALCLPPRREPPIRSISIEAPTNIAATQLVRDLFPFARSDLVALEGERWEVRVEDSSEQELDVVLQTVARWAAEQQLEEPHVLVDDAPVELPTPPE